MADKDLPIPRDYYIFTSESFNTDKPVGVTFDGGVVRATPGGKTAWSLEYVDKEKGMYTGYHTESKCAVGISEESDGSPGFGRRLEEKQHWTLHKTDTGYSLSREFGGVELFSYLDNDGQIKASPSSKGITSWVFQPVEG